MNSDDCSLLTNNTIIPPYKEKRWYDEYFIKNFINSFKTVPPFKRNEFAEKIISVIDNAFKHELHHKINTNKQMILGRYKEYHRRRWHDVNSLVFKSIKSMYTLI